MYIGPRTSPVCSLVGDQVSVSPQGPKLLDSFECKPQDLVAPETRVLK
ncbi:hypothetical protein T09_6792 [Trichinella sp. T9]|nr:hypothetical protein T09_6792 [Trichinella sp. T9]